MFRFGIAVVLIGVLYLGYEFVSTYKTQNMTVAEQTQQVQEAAQNEASETAQRLEREARVSKLMTPVWKLEKFSDKAWWIGVWGGGLFVLFGLLRVWASYRDKKIQGV